MSPLEGFKSSAQLTEKRMCGIIMGMMEMIRNMNLQGMSVRLFRYDRNRAKTVARVDEPRTKITVLRMISARAGSV